jgi:hypothetical protein
VPRREQLVTGLRAKRRRGDGFYFIFQTLPVIVTLVILTILAVIYGMVRLVGLAF